MSTKLITNYDYEIIRSKITWIRNAVGLNKRQFAMSISVQPSYVVELEQGNRKPSIGFLESLCLQYEISLNWLMFDFGPPYLSEIDHKNKSPRSKDHRLLVNFLDHWWHQYERKPRLLRWMVDKLRQDIPEFIDWEEDQGLVKVEQIPGKESGTN